MLGTWTLCDNKLAAWKHMVFGGASVVGKSSLPLCSIKFFNGDPTWNHKILVGTSTRIRTPVGIFLSSAL